ncbi:MAG TPA: fumarylacetoacetase, partial [Aliiroseovarius sp.]|nr:fumarylacetoacetase [Aliiroseovarius sp.]
MSQLKISWVESANAPGHPFPLNNLPYGVFSTETTEPHCGVAIGDMILDVTALEEAGVIKVDDVPVFDLPMWNEFMDMGAETWQAFRTSLTDLRGVGADKETQAMLAKHLIAQTDAEMHLPFAVSEYTDFYAGRHHATNVGTMFRGAQNALPPNWLHIP